MIRNSVFLCRKVGSIKGYFCRYIINKDITYEQIRKLNIIHDVHGALYVGLVERS